MGWGQNNVNLALENDDTVIPNGGETKKGAKKWGGFGKSKLRMRSENNGALWAEVHTQRAKLERFGQAVTLTKVTAHVADERQLE